MVLALDDVLLIVVRFSAKEQPDWPRNRQTRACAGIVQETLLGKETGLLPAGEQKG
jgi:hypothetical protein